jgi:hypothetical protein
MHRTQIKGRATPRPYSGDLARTAAR